MIHNPDYEKEDLFMFKPYRVQLSIQSREVSSDPWEEATQPVDLARFETLEEAKGDLAEAAKEAGADI